MYLNAYAGYFEILEVVKAGEPIVWFGLLA